MKYGNFKQIDYDTVEIMGKEDKIFKIILSNNYENFIYFDKKNQEIINSQLEIFDLNRVDFLYKLMIVDDNVVELSYKVN